MDEETKRQQILKQAPILAEVPADEQLAIFRRAARSPLLWSIVLGLFALLFYAQWDVLTEIINDPTSAQTAKGRGAEKFFRVFFPVILPAFGIIALAVYIRNRIIKNEVRKYQDLHISSNPASTAVRFPHIIMDGLSWAFLNPPYTSMTDFERDVIDYNVSLYGERPDLRKVEVNANRMSMGYMYWGLDEDGDEDAVEGEIVMIADNGKYFTNLEILFKAHNVISPKRYNDVTEYLEYVELVGHADDYLAGEAPIYFMQLQD